MSKYIDKQVAIAALSEAYDKITGLHPQFYNGYQSAVKQIKVFPTADVEPVRHARWIPEENSDVYFTCSYCGCEICTSWGYSDLEWNFCPECGYKMDGGYGND